MGYTLGAICPPINATVMYSWVNLKEPTFIHVYNHLGTFAVDFFSLWNGIEREILDCIAKLNTYHPTKIFDYKYSQNSSDFLDTTVYDNKEQNKLLTIAYCKPIDRENFSHQKSAHPRSLLESIP